MTSVSQLAKISKIVLPCTQAWLPRLPATPQVYSDPPMPGIRCLCMPSAASTPWLFYCTCRSHISYSCWPHSTHLTPHRSTVFHHASTSPHCEAAHTICSAQAILLALLPGESPRLLCGRCRGCGRGICLCDDIADSTSKSEDHQQQKWQSRWQLCLGHISLVGVGTLQARYSVTFQRIN